MWRIQWYHTIATLIYNLFYLFIWLIVCVLYLQQLLLKSEFRFHCYWAHRQYWNTYLEPEVIFVASHISTAARRSILIEVSYRMSLWRLSFIKLRFLLINWNIITFTRFYSTCFQVWCFFFLCDFYSSVDFIADVNNIIVSNKRYLEVRFF